VETVCVVGTWAAGSGLVSTVRDTREQVEQFLKRNTPQADGAKRGEEAAG